MELTDFKGIHKGKDVICIGNGPSLESISINFLRSRTSFGLNYLPMYNDVLNGFMPTYWMALDQKPLEMVQSLPPEMPKFTPVRKVRAFEANKTIDEYPNLIGFRLGDMEHPPGLGYGTTLLAAAHLATAYMEARRVFLVGFDCAKAANSRKPFVSGKTGCPHFYDPDHKSKEMSGWCSMFRTYDTWLRKRGQEIINLSHPTFCKSLEQGFFWDYMEVP